MGARSQLDDSAAAHASEAGGRARERPRGNAEPDVQVAHCCPLYHEAVELIGRAIAINPSVAVFHCNLAEAYRALGDLDETRALKPTGHGAVIIWDRGEYEQRGRVAWPEALQRGHAVFVLHGQKLRGGFALQRTRGGAKPQWLLIKRRDEGAEARRNPAITQPDSVKTGLTIEQVTEGDSES